MKSKWLCIMVMGLQAWSATAHASGTSTASATMEVSFRIVESCSIRAARDASATLVTCAYSSPYRLEIPSAAPFADGGQPAYAQAAGVVTVSF